MNTTIDAPSGGSVDYATHARYSNFVYVPQPSSSDTTYWTTFNGIIITKNNQSFTKTRGPQLKLNRTYIVVVCATGGSNTPSTTRMLSTFITPYQVVDNSQFGIKIESMGAFGVDVFFPEWITIYL